MTPGTQTIDPRAKRVTMLALGILSAATLLLVLSSRRDLDVTRLALGTALLWLCAYPMWRYFHAGERAIPYLPAMAAFYFFAYGMPAFNRELKVRTFRPEPAVVELTLLLATAGMVLLLLAFYWFRLPKGIPRVRLVLDLERQRTKLVALVAITTALRLLLFRASVAQELAQLRNFVTYLPVVFSSACFLLFLRGRLVRWQLLATIALVCVGLLLDFSTGSVAVPAFTLANLLFVYVAEKGRLPVLALAAIMVLFIPALATKLEYRETITKRGIGSTIEQLEVFGNLMGGVFSGERMSFADADEVTRSRVDHLSAFAYVVMKTPSVVPYWDGATYENFLWSFVPRLLAPEKPQKTMGQAYGHRYGFIARWDFGTSINLEQTVEMYANFGAYGVLFGMFLLGMIYRGLYSILNHPEAGDGGILIAASTFRVLLNIESDFSLVFGGIAQGAILLYLTLWVSLRRRAPQHGLATQPG